MPVSLKTMNYIPLRMSDVCAVLQQCEHAFVTAPTGDPSQATSELGERTVDAV